MFCFEGKKQGKTSTKFPKPAEILRNYEQDLKLESHRSTSSKLVKILKNADWKGKGNEIWCKQFAYNFSLLSNAAVYWCHTGNLQL